MAGLTRRLRRWGDAWLHSDLVGIPVTLAIFVLVVLCIAIILVIGNAGGVFVDKLLFPIGLLVLLILTLVLLGGRDAETTEGLSKATPDSPRRVLVIANSGLANPALCDAVCDRVQEAATEAMIVAPVIASSRMRALADDVDAESAAASARLEQALETLRRRGVDAKGHVDVGEPIQSLADGLREFRTTEVVMMRGGEPDWDEAENFAERVREELGVRVTEVNAASSPS